MANRQLLFKKAKNFLDTKISNSWLHNVYVLYFIFIIALGNAYYLMASSDWYYLSMFFILGFLVSFFSKNMIVILCIALAATNISKYGIKATMEGFQDDEEKEKEKEEEENSADNFSTDSKVKESIENKEKTKSHEDVKDDVKEEAYENPTEKSRNEKKDGFAQKPDGVYTSIEDMDISKVYDEKDNILKNQERILKNLNQYKPLLDTINSITKSVSSIKQSR